MKNPYLPLLLISSTLLFSQPKATSATEAENALALKKQMEGSSLVRNIPFTNIGPTVMSGRVVDVAVNPDNPVEFFVAYASGGVWHTRNNGTSFIPILDSSETQNVGDIAVDWTKGTLWVGTGENNASRSSYAGIGILKSTDGGKSWQNMGLPDSHHIGRILINPKNPDEVVVGVTGHLYSPNEERGVYKTTDGGNTWQKTLYINDETGIIDVAHDPGNFNTLYAAAWQKDRKAWNFSGNGSASGLYKSTDGGNNWTKISTSESGFPIGEGVGRIGLAVYDANTVYAVHDSQFRRAKTEAGPKQSDGLQKEDFKDMSATVLLKLSDKKLGAFLKANGFPERYGPEEVKQMVRSASIKPVDLFNYLVNANSLLFDTPVIGAEVYRSDDAGATWKKMNQKYINDLFYSYGYYFAQIRVAAHNKDKIYIAGVPLLTSDDGGNSWTSISDDNVHADHHALWVNPKIPGHLINGNDGGLNISYDDGAHWIKNNSPSVGQFYAINVDDEDPYNVYGGLQDNGVWKGPHNAKENSLWHQTGHYAWKSILGGDGMQVQIDARDANTVYTGFQFGNYFRLDLAKEKRKAIQPKHNLGEQPYRFNWQTPILLSPHNPDIVYLGSNKLHRSLNQGNDWEVISDDLTQGGKKGNVAYGTLATLSESPLKFGLIYTGSDDGLVHVTRNGGGSWELISESFPMELWVSRVAASKHKKGRVYVSLNGYRWDDFTPYIYMSDDYGANWKSISANIPPSPVNVILEDPRNENLLFAGTDNGVYVSLDQGGSWEIFQNGIPNVAVHDLVIQPREKHLLVGTHGRSIYRANIDALQELTPEAMRKELVVFDIGKVIHSTSWGNAANPWSRPNTPGIDLTFYTAKAGKCKLSIKTTDLVEVSATEIETTRGFNILSYDVAFSKSGKSAYLRKYKTQLVEANDGKTYLPKGNYYIEISNDGALEKVPFKIE